MANSGLTSNSTTSEGCCAAVRAACEILVERLTPLYQQLEAAAPDGEVSWETLISKVSQYFPKFATCQSECCYSECFHECSELMAKFWLNLSFVGNLLSLHICFQDQRLKDLSPNPK
jgi:hypothetical protein